MENEGATVVVVPPGESTETPAGESEATAVKVVEAKATAEHAADGVAELKAENAALREKVEGLESSMRELSVEINAAHTRISSIEKPAVVEVVEDPDDDDEVENSDTALVVADTAIVTGDDVIADGDGEREALPTETPAGFKRDKKRGFISL
jgi:seryl-tRNA synthetase